jgi:hypothetical protein
MKLQNSFYLAKRIAAGSAVMAMLISVRPAAAAEISADIAITPGAELVLVADAVAMRESPVHSRIKAFSEEQRAKRAPEEAAKWEAFAEEVKAMTGITEEDITAFVFSADLDNIDFASPQKPDVNAMDLAMGFTLRKPLSLETVKAVIAKLSAENEDMQVAMQDLQYNGIDVLSIQDVSDDPDGSTFNIVMLAGDTVLVAGTETGIHNAIDRAISGETVPAADALAAATMPLSQMTLLFTLPPALQQQLQDKAQAASTSNPDGMQSAFAMAFQNLQNISVGVNLTDALEGTLAVKLGSDAEAAQVKILVDSTVVAMIQFGLINLSSGKPMELMQSLKTETVPGGVVALSFRMTENDMQIIQEVAKRREEEAARQQKMFEETAPAGGITVTPMPEDAE